MKSFVLQVQGDLLMRNQVAQGRGYEVISASHLLLQTYTHDINVLFSNVHYTLYVI